MRRVLAGLVALPVFLFWLSSPGSPARPTCAQAAGTHHVAVAVEHGNGAVITTCVSFDETRLTGEQVMDRSGIQYATITNGGLGKAVCQIGQEPATYPQTCWTMVGNYWGMFVARGGGGWSVSPAGISSQNFGDGDALGWHYIPQGGAGGGPPHAPTGACTITPVPSPIPTPPLVPSPSPTASRPAATASPAAPAPPPDAPSPTATAGSPSISSPRSPPSEADPPTPAPPPSSGSSPAPPPAGPDLGWLVAMAGGGGLLGLLMVQILARRRGR